MKKEDKIVVTLNFFKEVLASAAHILKIGMIKED